MSYASSVQARANAIENTVPSTQEETMGPESFDREEMERHQNRIGRVKYKPAIRSFRVIKVKNYILGSRLEESNREIGLIKRNGSSNQKPIQIEFHLTWPMGANPVIFILYKLWRYIVMDYDLYF
jgi:hypothetical protein